MSKTIEELEKENKLLEKQIEQYKKINSQTGNLSSSTKSLYDEQQNYIGKWTMNVGTIATDTAKTIESMIKQFATPFDPAPFEELDIRATQLQNTFGATKGQLEGYKQIIADTIPELIKMGISEEQAVGNMGEIMKSMGSNASLGLEAITEISAAAKVSGVEIGKLSANFREVGVSVYDVGERMKEVTDVARGAGVSVGAVSQTVVSNLNKMNLYNFDNGVKGLANMAVVSERLGIKMESVFKVADKVFNPEGAIEMAAGLQRLGVTASGLLDPLKAMDLASNDPEGLQKEIVNITKEFTKFNEANGKFEIMPGSKRRLREIATEMNIPAEELAEMSIKAADFDMKMKQIQFPSLATDQQTKEMIAGMAQLQNGKAVINVKNEQTGEVKLKQVDQLTASDMESLKKQQEEDSMSIEEVAKEQLNVSQRIEANTRGAIQSVRMGKATTEPLEKMFTTIMGAKVATSENLANISTTRGSRETLTSMTQPMEDYIVGGVTGNEQMQKEATINFLKSLQDTETKIQTTTNDFLKNTVTDLSDILKESYGQPQKVETKSEITVNVKVTGDENTRGLNERNFEEMYTKLLTNPEMTSYSANQIEGGNQPSALTGSKNK